MMVGKTNSDLGQRSPYPCLGTIDPRTGCLDIRNTQNGCLPESSHSVLLQDIVNNPSLTHQIVDAELSPSTNAALAHSVISSTPLQPYDEDQEGQGTPYTP